MKKIILGLALLGSLAFGVTFSKEQVKEFEQKCEAGDSQACGYAGAFYQEPTEFGGNVSDRNYKKVLYYFKKACDGDYYAACSDLGTMYLSGEEVKKDYKKAIELLDKACKGGYGCNNLGVMYANGKGIKRDEIRAMGYYRRSCDAGNWLACGNFASHLENGGDRSRAAQYYQKACELGKKQPLLFDEDKNHFQHFCDKYDILK